MRSKKALEPVIAASLLLVVSVVAVVAFQAWVNEYSSSLLSQTESKSSSSVSSGGIDLIVGDELYYVNSFTENITYSSVSIGGVDCLLNGTLVPGLNTLNVTSCLSNVTESKNEIVVVTENGVDTKFQLILQVAGQNSSSGPVLYESCKEIYDNNASSGNGTYTIYPSGYSNSSFNVFCDMDDGGWTWLVGNPLYNDSSLPFEPLLNGVNYDYTSGQFNADQGNNVSGFCRIPNPYYIVQVRFDHQEFYLNADYQWFNVPVFESLRIDENDDSTYESERTVPGTSGSESYTLTHTASSVINLSEIRAVSNSCQNTGNYLSVNEARVK